MIIHGEPSTGSVRAVAGHLASEYAGVVPPALVESVVRGAVRDLRGQIAPGSLGPGHARPRAWGSVSAGTLQPAAATIARTITTMRVASRRRAYEHVGSRPGIWLSGDMSVARAGRGVLSSASFPFGPAR